MNSVSWMRIRERTPRMVAGSVVSRTCSRGWPRIGPNGFRRTSEQTLERLRERLDALDLELACHLVEVDADFRQLLQLALGQFDVLIDAPPHLAVLAERGQGGGRNRVHRVGSDQLFDVIRVGIARVLGRGARPQRALQLGAGLLQLVPPRAAERLPEMLVGDLGVRDGGLSIKTLERPLLAGVGAQLDLLTQGLVY